MSPEGPLCQSVPSSSPNSTSHPGKLVSPSSETQDLGNREIQPGSGIVILPAFIGKSPEVALDVNGVPMTGVIDTGSQVTTMTESYFMEKFGCQSLEKLHWLSINTATTPIPPVQRLLEADVKVGDCTVPRRGVLVVRVEKPVPMRIGMNVVENLNRETFLELVPLK